MTPPPAPENLIRRIDLRSADPAALARALRLQWLATNGIGGYASAAISGALLWKYHGLLVSALPGPLGRVVMLDSVADGVRLPDGRLLPLGVTELSPAWEPQTPHALAEFRVERHQPVWIYEVEGIQIEKRIWMVHLQNTLHISYTLRTDRADLRIELSPAMRFRLLDSPSGAAPPADGYEVRWQGTQMEVRPLRPFPPLRLHVDGNDAAFTASGGAMREVYCELDAERGFEARNQLWSPGYFSAPLRPETALTLVASSEDWHTALALPPQMAHRTEAQRRRKLLELADPHAGDDRVGAELLLAADQFLIAPAGRVRDAAEAHATGDELRAVVAGYPWFTDWGRDTMISLEGLTGVTGRHVEAAWILRAYGRYVRDGLVPNLFPEGGNEGLYHTADATLWFFHALDRYIARTGDLRTRDELLPVLREVVRKHIEGTRFGIGVDPQDGLLRQGAEGKQLTWMDAKVGDWVVTPRRGKAVEINALWYQALQLMENWERSTGNAAAADELKRRAELTRASFNRRFWNPKTGCLFDVVDGEGGDDPAIRPNQVFAISLPHAVLDQGHWAAVLEVVEQRLLTPFGLRSLDPAHPDYKPRYSGDLRSRDAAYHQGTVWAWLIGPWIDAWLKVHGDDRAGARRFLAAFDEQLSANCVGTIAEIFDAEPPFTARGCVAQAWSVAEVLRCLALTNHGG